MNPILKLLAGLAAVFVLALAALFAGGLPGSAPSAQEKLRARIAGEFSGPETAWAQFRIDGQKLVVSGNAPSGEARNALLARIDAAGWKGGYFFGAVTAVDTSRLTTATAAAPFDGPFLWGAERRAEGLVFSGSVPSQQTRDALYTLAAMLFPEDGIAGSLEVAAGAPADDTAWSEAASASLRALAYLEQGQASAAGSRLSLKGDAADETRARAARMLMEALPEGFSSKTDVSVPQAVAAPDAEAPSEAPAVAPSEPAEADDEAMPEDTCLADLSAAIESRRIGFSSARAELGVSAREQLTEIAGVLMRCPDVRISVTGHTDSSGSAARNRQLSAYRADAVRAYLISLGVEANRVTARGAGSSEPLASNASAAGRERNRRIEIGVVSGE